MNGVIVVQTGAEAMKNRPVPAFRRGDARIFPWNRERRQ